MARNFRLLAVMAADVMATGDVIVGGDVTAEEMHRTWLPRHSPGGCTPSRFSPRRPFKCACE